MLNYNENSNKGVTMNILKELIPERVFKYFEEISAIPRGSGNMQKIAAYCTEFARSHGLKYECDEAFNVIIYKDGTEGFENAQPVILQGHLDMVCQKTADSTHDFEKDGLSLYIDGDFIKAKNTTLGADNGIAVAMIMAILESDSISHPPIEAVFTTDEEIGMIGASKLDMSKLKSRRMLNLDSECIDVLTVSCAGGARVECCLPIERKEAEGTEITVTLEGLLGGHSGVEIDKGRINANVLMGRILLHMQKEEEFDIISINGGDKDNVITSACKASLTVKNAAGFTQKLTAYLDIIKEEIKAREPQFSPDIAVGESGHFHVISEKNAKSLIDFLSCSPYGVMQMSADIDGLVETSLNLGIVKTDETQAEMIYALRSNKQSALLALEEKIHAYASVFNAKSESSGHYPPWEFVSDSEMQRLYIETYEEMFGKKPSVEAIHAGLECGMFSSCLPGLDCISFGPIALDIHSVNERLSISSVKETFEMVLEILKKM